MMEEEQQPQFNMKELEEQMENDKGYQFKNYQALHFENYYALCFPYKKIFNWLSYSRTTKSGKAIKSDYFNRREISYMVPSKDNQDEEFCIRHLCYSKAKDFEEDVKRYNPKRIDIGPVCDIIPSKSKDNTHDKPVAIEREFVIDIDMTDYDNIRTCCKGKTICESCWKFLTAAYEVLKASLEEDFGFEHILWVFSGRRGIHAWVCDERARVMDNSVRGGVSRYLDISVSNEKMDNYVIDGIHRNPDYPLFRRSYDILKEKFEDFVVKEQAFFIYKVNIEKVLKILKRFLSKHKNGKSLLDKCDRLQRELYKDLDSKLYDFKQEFKRPYKGKNYEYQSEISLEVYKQILNFFTLHPEISDIQPKLKMEIVIGLMYPKIDFHVSAQTNHLLKCPFNIHSGTGLLSIPIDDFDNFKISDVPYVQDVVAYQKKKGWKHPNFKRFLDYFDGFCEKLLKNEILVKEKLEKMMNEEKEVAAF